MAPAARRSQETTQTMKHPPLPILLCALGFAVAVRGVETLGTVPDSAGALGMSGGRYANLTDPSAVHYSPANITEIKSTEALFNFSAWHGDIQFKQDLSGETVRMQDPWKILGSFYFVQPIVPEKVVFGIGVTTPFGLDSQWPHQGPLRYLIPYEATLVTADITPVIAFKPTESLSIAAGLDIMYSEIELKQFFPWPALLGGLPVNDGIAHYKADGLGVGAFASATWKITPHQRLAVIGRLPVNVDYDGDFRISKVPRQLAGTDLGDDSDFDTDIRFPASITVGYGIDITDRLTLGADLLWADNSSHNDVPIRIGKNQPLLGTGTGLTTEWEDAFTVGVGGEYRLGDHWRLRAGYMYSEESQSDKYYTPSVASNDRHLMSAGIGYHTEHHHFDIGYCYSYFPDRTVKGALTPGFDGEYQIRWHVISASYTFKF